MTLRPLLEGGDVVRILGMLDLAGPANGLRLHLGALRSPDRMIRMTSLEERKVVALEQIAQSLQALQRQAMSEGPAIRGALQMIAQKK